MADLFTPRVWTDGAAADTGSLTAARGPNRWETALGALDDALADLADEVAAIVAASAGLTPNRVRTGASADRGTPERGALYWDADLDRLLVGNGSRWEGADGAELVGDGGTGTAATTILEIGQTGDDSVAIGWAPVVGVDHYELRESASPTGVAGFTAIGSGLTAIEVTGLIPRVYEFWVVAVFPGGAVSADSNHELIDVTTTGGVGAATTPWGILGMGPGGGGYWDIGIGYPSGHVNTPYAQLVTGYTATPYFIPTADLTGVQFRARMDGATTSAASDSARSELREYNGPGGTTKAAWVASNGTHVLEYTFRLEHLQPGRPYVMIGQVHSASNDVVSIRVRGTTTSNLNVEAWILSSRHATNLVTGYVIGQNCKIRIEFTSGTLKLYANNTLKITDTTSFKTKTAAEMYFKVGSYPLSSTAKYGESASEYCLVRLIGALVCTHSTGSSSGVEVTQEKAFQLTSTAENSTVNWWDNYDYIQDILDGRGYTGGIVGFTSATADMLAVVQDYVTLRPTGNTLQQYVDNLQATTAFGDTVDDAEYGVDGGGASDIAASQLGAPFRTAWANAANTDALFRQAQRDYRTAVYWLPAYNAAIADGLGALGIAIYYDTSINHGPGEVSSNDGSFDDIRSRTTGTKPSAGGSESTWLTNFLNRRSAVLTEWGDNPSDGRISMLRGLITAGKFTLTTPFTWSVYGDSFTMSTDPTPRTD